MSVITLPSARPEAPQRHTTPGLPAFAKTPVLLIAGAVALVLLLTSGRYGYFADELYFIAAGHQLSWGYADQTPLVPLIAATMDTLFPGSLVALRIPAIVFAAAGISVVASLAREFGGARLAQTLAAGATAVSLQTISGGHLVATASFDMLLWTMLTWLLVRWVRVRDDRLLLGAGLVTAVSFQVKMLVPVFWVVAGVVALVLGPRDLLRRPKLWLGGLITTVTAVPTMIWQASHGWPQLEMSKAIAAENFWGWTWLPMAVLNAGIVGGAFAVFGLWRLLWSSELRPWRFLGWTAVGVIAFAMATSGRPYYVCGLYGLLMAVGAVELCKLHSPKRRYVTAAYAVSAVVAGSVLPILPMTSIQKFDTFSVGSIGWPEVTSEVADTARKSPGAVVLTDDYWSASALRHYQPELEVYSPNRGFYYLGQPSERTQRAIYVGSSRQELKRHFGSVERVDTIDTNLGVDTRYEGMPIHVVAEPLRPWSQVWPRMHRMLLDASLK